ncbi:excinuclease ABC subunit C [Sulfurifustis variabilis]|uniref:UvrABC system protein C n=1 Tax=Sulfurifustis variabilis TaxID=1675686 RepID=A0A1B4V418_9GAMM|nr:excinuclease ABC subunit UvrC [Sulfurifustis variabilis]BAU48266.1 excinuclease ABC subunit C [Sulfurifustis variabilis]
MNAPELQQTLKDLPAGPGVYRFLGPDGEVLYVGKARSLRKRVASYFRAAGQGLSPKVQAMVARTERLEVTVTHTETEALLLENNLIKSLKPRYNVVLRDDKSYPYIFVSEAQEWPRLAFHRGAKREKGRYFGPYPSAAAVRESLNLLQKVFPVRQCEDSFFRNRSRPCLQYQIKRCSAPCVGLVEREHYLQDVRHAILFLEGKSRQVVEEMMKRMENAARREDYETAALYRDRIAALKRVQERQYITGRGGEADVLAVAMAGDAACIQVSFVRGGMNLGSKSFFPKPGQAGEAAEVLAAFLPQYYLNAGGAVGKPIPERIYLSHAISDEALLEEAFSQAAGRAIAIHAGTALRGAPRRWAKMAELNAAEELRRAANSRMHMEARFEALKDALDLEEIPGRVECFDISHTMGEAAVASCVVFDRNGPVKSDYRRFNIRDIEPGDDYGAIAQALERRYRKVKEGEGEPEISRRTPGQGGPGPAPENPSMSRQGRQVAKLPDMILIDGGKGQVSAAHAVLDELQIDDLALVGVAKGRERKPGLEQLFLWGRDGPTILPADSPALHLIQQIRDEAHRFAITGHRQRRARARTTSPLESIPGIGDKRRQALLRNLGGMREVARAGVEDLARVPGISPELARRIYDAFHEQEHQ